MADRPRALQACDACKRRKVRCNGQPRCQQCTHLDLKCTYAANKPGWSRKTMAKRGKVIAECRGVIVPWSTVSLAPADSQRPLASSIPRTIPSHPNPSFFLGLLPEYMSYVYPMSPVIAESEIRTFITQMDENPDAASFVYAFAAVTINLTQTEPVQCVAATREHLETLLTRSFEHRRPIGLDAQPTLVNVMNNIFAQICLVRLRKLDLGFLYLREAISLLYVLKIDSEEVMSALEPTERASRQRAYWECFIHERFTALTCYKPTCLGPLPSLPDHDSSISPDVEKGFNHIIQSFRLVDREFLDFWLGDRSGVTSNWVEQKQLQLEDDQWHREVSRLPLMQQADLIITRQWLRTLTWQIALSNILLSSTAPSLSLSPSFPVQLSNQLRQFLVCIPPNLVGIHGSSILEKLFEIMNTITDVVLHLVDAGGNDTIQRINDIIFLKNFIFSFPGFANLRTSILTQKFKVIREKHPEIKEMEMLV